MEVLDYGCAVIVWISIGIGWYLRMRFDRDGYQDQDRTYTPNERQLSSIFDCKQSPAEMAGY